MLATSYGTMRKRAATWLWILGNWQRVKSTSHDRAAKQNAVELSSTNASQNWFPIANVLEERAATGVKAEKRGETNGIFDRMWRQTYLQKNDMDIVTAARFVEQVVEELIQMRDSSCDDLDASSFNAIWERAEQFCDDNIDSNTTQDDSYGTIVNAVIAELQSSTCRRWSPDDIAQIAIDYYSDDFKNQKSNSEANRFGELKKSQAVVLDDEKSENAFGTHSWRQFSIELATADFGAKPVGYYRQLCGNREFREMADSSIDFQVLYVTKWPKAIATGKTTFSPDGIALVASSPTDERFYAVLEYKTSTRAGKIDSESAIAERWSRFASVKLESGSDSVKFMQLITEQGHRSQLFHNIISGSLGDGFIICASTSPIIRTVHVTVDADIVDANLFGPVPIFSPEELGHCGDCSTLYQQLTLLREMNARIKELGQPLPPAEDIIPTAITMWNREKGGIDVYSRLLKNAKSRHERLPPLAAIWLRLFMTLIYNAFQPSQLLQVVLRISWMKTVVQHTITIFNARTNRYHIGTCRDAASGLGVFVNASYEPRQPLAVVDQSARSTKELGLVSPNPHSFANRVRDHFNDNAE
ncbi:hypothetical protein ON010_g5419 [Phytophthora cinnamomi]|nr:hypothetical protein ON010_g5419 [Phytophthora cinnamomi]